MPSDIESSAWKELVKRELDHVRQDIAKAHEDIGRANIVLTDAQVRLATLEGKRPVSRDEFDPIKRLVWGFVGTVLFIVLIAVLALVVIRTGPTGPMHP